jgi:hypothetical protein
MSPPCAYVDCDDAFSIRLSSASCLANDSAPRTVAHIQLLEIGLHKIGGHFRALKHVVNADRPNVFEKNRAQLVH